VQSALAHLRGNNHLLHLTGGPTAAGFSVERSRHNQGNRA